MPTYQANSLLDESGTPISFGRQEASPNGTQHPNVQTKSFGGGSKTQANRPLLASLQAQVVDLDNHVAVLPQDALVITQRRLATASRPVGLKVTNTTAPLQY